MFGVGAEEYAADDGRAWMNVMWAFLVEGRASGALATHAATAEAFEWGGKGVPLKETFGRTADAVAAVDAHMAAAPALPRPPPEST